MLRPLLEGERYKVLWCRNGGSGVTQAVESRPDVIILELDLPDGDGFTKLDRLGGHIHHARRAAVIDVGEFFHPPMAIILRPGR